MIDFTLWRNEPSPTDVDFQYKQDVLKQEREVRQDITDETIHDLIFFGIQQGYTDNQIQTAIEDLFFTFANEWWLYERLGHPALIAAISSDATLPWLDLDAQGITIRQRLINRLS